MHKDKKNFHLLVVEDNEGDYFLIKDYLEELILAPQISRAVNFKQAYHALNDENNSFDVILLDLSLPDKNGFELIEEVLALHFSIPVIVLTGYTDFSFAVTSLAMGISDYLLKDDLTAMTLYKSVVYNIERNKNIKSLKESEQRYADLFHLSPQPMWVIAEDNQKFLDVNEAAIRDYGYEYDEVLSMSFYELLAQEEENHINTNDLIHREGSKATLHGTFTLRNKKGEFILAEIRSNNIKFKGKTATVLLAHDITERYNYVQAIEKQNKLLREIAWTQSHVVRAPLARMLGLINLISEDSVLLDEKVAMMDHLINSAHELDKIVIDITNKAQQIIPQTYQNDKQNSHN